MREKICVKLVIYNFFREEGQIRAFHYGSLNAYSKHKKLVNDYIRYYSGGKSIQEVFKRDT